MAQSVAINTDGSTADASAALDIKSTEKEMLIPRMTMAQKDAIASPANGLLIYQTDNTPGFYYYNGAGWASIQTVVNSWGTLGNAGTNPATNFLGTTDNQPLSFKLNNIPTGKWDAVNSNYFIGNNSGLSITSGTGNIGIADEALRNNTIGINNTALGIRALKENSTGSFNIALGVDALFSNTVGHSNTALGFQTLPLNTSGENNTAAGRWAMGSNTTGNFNAAFGAGALSHNTTGVQHVAVGFEALHTNTTADNNTAVGFRSLFSNTTGTQNVALGVEVLRLNITGIYNTALGFQAMYPNTTGNNNTAIGRFALNSNITGSNNTMIGFGANVTTDGLNNATSIGASSAVACSNCLVLGGTGVNAVKVGIGTQAPATTLEVIGTSTTSNLILNGSGNGVTGDFLIKSNVSGLVAGRKGYAGLGLNYIICVAGGDFPSTGAASNQVDKALIGEIKLFCWQFCPKGLDALPGPNTSNFN